MAQYNFSTIPDDANIGSQTKGGQQYNFKVVPDDTDSNTPTATQLNQNIGQNPGLNPSDIWNGIKALGAGIGSAGQNIGNFLLKNSLANIPGINALPQAQQIQNAVSQVLPSSVPAALNTNLMQNLNVPNNPYFNTLQGIGQVAPAFGAPEIGSESAIANLLGRYGIQSGYGAVQDPNNPGLGSASYALGQGASDIFPFIIKGAGNIAESMNPVNFTKNLVSQLKDYYTNALNTATNGTGNLGGTIRNMAVNIKQQMSDLFNSASQGSKLLNDGNLINIQDPEAATLNPTYVTQKKLKLAPPYDDPMYQWENKSPAQQQQLISAGYVKPVAAQPISDQVQAALPPEIHEVLATSPFTKDLYGSILSGDQPPSWDNFEQLKKNANSGFGQINADSPKKWQQKTQLGAVANYIKNDMLIPHLTNVDSANNTNFAGEYQQANSLHANEFSNLNNPSYRNIYDAAHLDNRAVDAQDLNSELQKGLNRKEQGTSFNSQGREINPLSQIGQMAPSVNAVASFEKSQPLMDIINGKVKKPDPFQVVNALHKGGIDSNGDPFLSNAYDAMLDKMTNAKKIDERVVAPLSFGMAALANHGSIPRIAMEAAFLDKYPMFHKILSKGSSALLRGIGNTYPLVNPLMQLSRPYTTTKIQNSLNTQMNKNPVQ